VGCTATAGASEVDRISYGRCEVLQIYPSGIAEFVSRQRLSFFTHLNFSQLPIFFQVCQVRIAFSELNVYEAAFKALFYYLRIDQAR
jgi:hypothetical protein